MANYRRLYLDGYSYFITVVTHRRNPILIENIDLLRQSFRESKERYRYRIDAIVILPDHFHMIITPDIPTEYPEIIRAVKYHFSRNIDPKYFADIDQSDSRWRRGSKPVWQKRFYEHTIRDGKDMDEKMEYIRGNPIKHALVNIWNDWKYSSFA